MELLRELAQETPLPAPAELDAVPARLVAAIATDPATAGFPAAPQVTAHQPASSAFFKSARALRSRPPSQISGP